MKINDSELIKKIALLHKEKHKEIRKNKDWRDLWINPATLIEGEELERFKEILHCYQLYSHLNVGLQINYNTTCNAKIEEERKNRGLPTLEEMLDKYYGKDE